MRSRSAFLDGGYYLPAADALLRIADRYAPGGLLADAGCGEGYYSVHMAGNGRTVFGADLSRSAADHAAKRAAAAGKADICRFAVASVFELPLADGCADAVLCMFSPCAEREYTRVLKPGGVLIYDPNGVVRPPQRKDIRVYAIPATEEAARLGNIRVFNTMILGGYLKVKPVVSLDNVFRGLAKSLPERMASLIPANEAAIQKGMEIIRVPEMVA